MQARGKWCGLCLVAAGCATTPATAIVNGVAVPRPTLEFGGQPYKIRHSRAHPQPGGPSAGLRADGGQISGEVCGVDIRYDVEHKGDHIQLIGFLDNSSPTQLEVRDEKGQRTITGSLGGSAVDLRVRSNQIIGRVELRYYDLRQTDDQLVGEFKVAGTDEPVPATVNGRDALWAMPPADQAAVLPTLLTCYVAQIGNYGHSPLTVGFGGKPGSMPRGSSDVSSTSRP